MLIAVFVVLLFAAHLNLTALVPAAPGQAAPPWWVGGRLVWPFMSDTRTLLPAGSDALNTATPLLAIAACILFAMAAAALMQWMVPAGWFPWLVVAGAVCSIALQIIWISPYAILPLVIDAVLLWAVFGAQATVASLRG